MDNVDFRMIAMSLQMAQFKMMSLIKSHVKSSQYTYIYIYIYSSDLNLVVNNLIKSRVIIYTAVAICSQP